MTRREILTTALTVLLIGGLFAIASPAVAGNGVADEPFESTGGEFEATAQSGNVTLELDPSSVSVASGETALVDVVVNHTTGDNNGIGGYNDVNVSVGDTSTAQIDSYNLTSDSSGDSSEITGNNQTLSLDAVTFANFSTAQPTYTIANVTVEGVSSSGSTGLEFDPSASNTVSDFDGNFTYTVDGFDNSTVDVSSQTPEAALSNLQVAGQGSSASIVWGDQNDTAVDVENIGGADGSFDVRLVVENSSNVEVINQTTSQQVLQGQTETVTFQNVTAGLAPDSYDVNVTALANDSTTGTLTVTEGSVDGVNLTPGADQSITAGTDIEFGAEAVNRNGNVVETNDQPFDWDAEGGSIANITGTFTERTAGTYNVTATLDGVTSAPTLVTITPDDTDTVTITPSGPVSTTAGTGIDFSAEALDRFGNTVESADSNFSWGGDGGSINSTGFFNATTTDVYNVSATFDFVRDETQVTVEPAPADSVSITPPGPEFPTAGDTVAFSAEAFDQFGNLNESDDSQFTWDAEGGSISTDGLFDETTTGTYNVTATLGSATSDEATVTLAANDTVDVQISPSADRTIQSGGTVPFNATSFDQFGNVNESDDISFNWDAEGGSIGISGLFDETTVGTYNVTATQTGTGVTSNETQVTVTAGSVDRVQISPSTDQAITAGGQAPFNATAFDSDDNVVEDDDSNFNWTADGGAITTAGLFEETTVGSYNVTASFGGTTSAVAQVTVEPGSVASVSLTPGADQTIAADGSIEFSAQALDQFGNVNESDDNSFAWSSTNGGLIGADGSFPETTAGTYNVTAEFSGVTSDPTEVTVVPAAAESVTISPSVDQTLTAGDSQPFSANATDPYGNLVEDADSNFNWSAEGGSISGDGLFDETTAGTYNVTAEFSGVTSDETLVTVQTGAVNSVTISPSTDQTIQSGGSIPFSAEATDQFGNVNESTDSAFTWAAEGGSISGDGLFDETATGSYNVTAALDGVTSSPTAVTVSPSAADRVELEPSADQTLTAGDAIPFNATAFDAADNVVETDNSTFNWAAEGGSISTSGVFSETDTGTYNVTASLGSAVSNITQVTVQPAPADSVSLSPSADQTLTAGGVVSLAFSATATDQFGNVVQFVDSNFNWSAEGGSISGDGEFDETTAGSYNVTAEFSGITSNETQVTVTPGAVDSVTISPSADQTLTAGGSQPFSATATDQFGNLVEDVDSNFDWSAEGGSIGGDGLFDETTAGTYNVTASLNGVTSDETLVAVQPASVDSVTISATGPTTIAAGGQVGFNATALDQFGNIVEDGDSQFDWSPATGVITGSGVFDEQTAGTYDVSASINGVTSTATTVTVNPAAVDTVTISPSADQTVTAGTDVAFSAEAFDQFGNVNESTDGAFTWSSTNGGSINATGYFEEPSTGTYDVTASLDGVTSTATTVTVNPAAVNTVAISPAADQTIQSGGSQSFSAEALDQFGNLNESTDSAFTWAAEGGSISGDGLFDESALGTYNVTATLDGVTSAPTAVTVEQATIDRVEIDPATDRTITAGDTVGFNATAFDASDSIIDDMDGNFTWEAEGGSISTDGVFSETSAGTYNVTASLDGIGSAPTQVTVTADTVDTITLSPSADQTITAGDTVGFNASALDQFGNLIEDDDSQFTWDASGGSIGGTGVFGDTNPGTYDVTAAFDGTTSAPTRVTVQTGALDSVEITPAADQTIQPGETLAFSATARDPVGNVVENVDGQFNWSAEGGAINATGAFSESTPGTYNVTAEFGGITSPQTTVTVTASQPEIGPDADLRIGGAAVTSILTGADGDVFVDVTNVGQAAASFELALEFQTPDGTTVGGFDTVNTSELGANAQETVSFTGVTGDLTVIGFYDIVVSATQSGEQFNDTDAFSVAVDVDNNGLAAADAANGPAKFDGMFDSVSGQSNDDLGIVDVVALFENFDRDVVDDNAEFFRFNDPDDPDPTRVGIADVVALFQEV
jgi:hypothetical protein